MLKRVPICSRAQGRVSLPVDAVEHHASRAFEKSFVGLKLREVNHLVKVKPVRVNEVVEDVFAAFEPTCEPTCEAACEAACEETGA